MPRPEGPSFTTGSRAGAGFARIASCEERVGTAEIGGPDLGGRFGTSFGEGTATASSGSAIPIVGGSSSGLPSDVGGKPWECGAGVGQSSGHAGAAGGGGSGTGRATSRWGAPAAAGTPTSVAAPCGTVGRPSSYGSGARAAVSAAARFLAESEVIGPALAGAAGGFHTWGPAAGVPSAGVAPRSAATSGGGFGFPSAGRCRRTLALSTNGPQVTSSTERTSQALTRWPLT